MTRRLLHFSTMDVDADRLAAVGAIPMPTGPSRVRLFLDGGGVIDVQETREQARDIWLGTESAEARYSRLVEENAALRLAFDRVEAALKATSDQSPREDLLRTIQTAQGTLRIVRENLT